MVVGEEITKLQWERQRMETLEDIQGNITGGIKKEITGCSEMKQQGVRTEAILEVTVRTFSM